jgi:cell division protease FtsH
MSTPPQDNKKPSEPGETPRREGGRMWLFIIILLIIAVTFYVSRNSATSVDYPKLKKHITEGKIARVDLYPLVARGRYKPTTEAARNDPDALGERFKTDLSPSTHEELHKLLDTLDVAWGLKPPDNTSSMLLTFAILFPLVILFFFWLSYRRRNEQMMGGGFLSGFSKSPAVKYATTDKPIMFKDVAGLVAAKEDLQEIVEFLKSPEKFQRLGGQIPKGVLLNGPPGTGKTLLARAIAGEADVPFFSVNGSEFIQMFVGVGASRVRDLFRTAKEQAPAIIFIDEIDAVGRQRGAGLGGGHDEREQTLNQILGEMDGFDQHESTIVIAATNRPDVLDPALLRPGRFDRHVTVDRPTQRGRKEIFKVHVRNVPLGDDVDLGRLASGCVGFTGADIRNMVNEAALWAARQDKKRVEMEDFDFARDKIIMGAKREEVLKDEDKEKTAYHEAGHTLASWFLTGADRVHKVTIVPRGRSLGATQMLPQEDRVSMSEKELRDHLIVLLGGRAAELLIYDETTVGAENDLERATAIARRMVTRWGMSKELGPVSYKLSDEDPFLGREIHQQRQFSEHTMELIDGEVATILNAAAASALALLKQKRDDLEKVAQGLLENEELGEDDLTELIGPSVHPHADEDDPGPVSQPAASEPMESPAEPEERQAGRTPLDYEPDQ